MTATDPPITIDLYRLEDAIRETHKTLAGRVVALRMNGRTRDAFDRAVGAFAPDKPPLRIDTLTFRTGTVAVRTDDDGGLRDGEVAFDREGV